VIQRHRDAIFIWALLVLLAYVMLAQIVFAFRHPWATDTERFLYFGRALTFGTVDYSEARPRE
jgi:hypothetical protein